MHDPPAEQRRTEREHVHACMQLMRTDALYMYVPDGHSKEIELAQLILISSSLFSSQKVKHVFLRSQQGRRQDRTTAVREHAYTEKAHANTAS
jgi:hypothetical protein